MANPYFQQDEDGPDGTGTLINPDTGRSIPVSLSPEERKFYTPANMSAAPQPKSEEPFSVDAPAQPQIQIGEAQIEKAPKSTAPRKLDPSTDAALDMLVEKYPGTTKEGYLRAFDQESGGNPGARNPKTGAAGLFQLMPDQAKAMGVDDVTKLPKAQQIELFDKYLAAHGVAPKSDADIGMAIGAPGAVGKSDNEVVYPKGSKEASLNPAWQDANGNVTVGSMKAYYAGTGSAEPSEPTPTSKIDRLRANLNAPLSTPGQESESTQLHRQAGPEFTPEDEKALAERGEKNAANLKAAYEPIINAQADLQEQQLKRQAELQQQMDDAAQREKLAQDKYEGSLAKVQAAHQAVLDDKEPPPWTSKNTGVGILAAVFQAMGAYGAAITHSKNFASDLINDSIRRDSEIWQRQHLDKKFNAENMEKMSAQERHDYEFQVSEHRLQQRMLVDHEIQTQLQRTKDAEIQSRLGILLANNQDKIAEEKLAMQRAARGSVSTTIGKSTVGGVSAPADVATINKRAEDYEKAGLATKEDIAAARNADVPVSDKDRQAYIEGKGTGQPGMRTIEQSERNIVEAAKTLGYEYDPKSRSFKVPEGQPDLVARSPVSGAPLGPTAAGVSDIAKKVPIAGYVAEKTVGGGADSEARKKAYLALRDAAGQTVKEVFGRTNQKEIDMRTEQLFGYSQQSMAENLNRMMRDIQAKREELNAAFPGAAKDYSRRSRVKEQEVTADTEAP